MAPPRPPPPDVSLRELLAELGFAGRNEAPARQELEKVGLTRPGKQRIATHKREQVEQVLRKRFLLLCGRAPCRQAASDDQRVVLQAERPSDCVLCSGSGNRQAVDRLCQALQQRGVGRLVIVGGSPSVRETLQGLFAGRVELRLIDGTGRRTQADARGDLRWADLVVIWGGTELDHKVSTLYTDSGDPRVVAVHRRGIAALADGLRESLERNGLPQGRR